MAEDPDYQGAVSEGILTDPQHDHLEATLPTRQRGPGYPLPVEKLTTYQAFLKWQRGDFDGFSGPVMPFPPPLQPDRGAHPDELLADLIAGALSTRLGLRLWRLAEEVDTDDYLRAREGVAPVQKRRLLLDPDRWR